ncbi:MAG TPA: ABC transporter ATP-binding protein [Planctomycetota bacterium]|nr:ABC transporter ATP-binding protein [Planctomycetota bacterium]
MTVPTAPASSAPAAPAASFAMDDRSRVFIRAENLSLQFMLYRNKGMQLKEFLLDLLPQFLRKAPPAGDLAHRKSFYVLENLSFQIQAGTRLGIIGRNGAGKSTLLRSLARIYQPTAGRIVINGRLAALIEIGSGFDPELTAYENILLGGSLLGRPVREMRSRSDAIIDFAGIREFADVPIKYYSTGMNLRLAFALATDVEPEILLLDEMFAGGDLDFQARAKTRMEALVEKTKIMVLVSHDGNLIRQYCTEVMWLEHGRIRQHGPVDEVLNAYAAAAYGTIPLGASTPSLP